MKTKNNSKKGTLMNTNNKKILLLTLCAVIYIPHSNAKRSFKKLTSFFGGQPYEEVHHKEFPADSIKTVTIENIDGPITIKTGWKKNSLFLKATKRSKKQEHISGIKVAVNRTKKNNKLLIKSNYSNKKIRGSVEYELIVPSKISVQLKTINGDIFVNDSDGPIHALAKNGNITIMNAKNTVHAKTTKKGNIIIENTCAPIQATAHYGNITIDKACSSIIANTTKGKVHVDCKNVPSTSIVKLESKSGSIVLALPTQVNASIKGQTNHGTLFSDHYITLKPYATKLNSSAWNRFKKEVNGTLGSGEATILLRSNYGNVKIVETKTT